tara:strand:+ start:1236 stop:2822 length:1587 start_codon:yes stop_codon:yes gene_type:complete
MPDQMPDQNDRLTESDAQFSEPQSLPELDNEYVRLLARQEEEQNAVNQKRTARVLELSSRDVKKQLYEMKSIPGHGLGALIQDPKNDPGFATKEEMDAHVREKYLANEPYEIPKALRREGPWSSMPQGKAAGEILTGTPSASGGSPFMKAASTLAQAQMGAPVYAGKKIPEGEIYNYLTKDKNLSGNHARGIIANIRAESNFYSGALEGEGAETKKDRGVGLFQHTYDKRKKNFLKAVPDYATNWKGQIDFALTEPEAQAFIKTKFKSAGDAAEFFARKFERPAKIEEAVKTRREFANSSFDLDLSDQSSEPTKSFKKEPGKDYTAWLDTEPSSGQHTKARPDHDGIDWALANKTPIAFPADGFVTAFYGDNSLDQGITVRWESVDGQTMVKLFHLDPNSPIGAKFRKERQGTKQGDALMRIAVRAGDPFALSGNSGTRRKDGKQQQTHLHLEPYQKDKSGNWKLKDKKYLQNSFKNQRVSRPPKSVSQSPDISEFLRPGAMKTFDAPSPSKTTTDFYNTFVRPSGQI